MNLFSFIKSKLSILEIIGSFTTLQKAGHYWKGRCPFHHERTPSFTVSPDKEIFYCFGCHESGDIVSFIAKIENCTPLEAVHFLSERHNIALPQATALQENTNKSLEHKKKYLRICQFLARWAHQQLKVNNDARSYLEGRAITTSSIKAFTLGYFPAGQAAVRDLLTFAQKESILASDLIEAHILFEGKGSLYSPFEDRILFPIKDHLGNFCGFGGRIFKPHDNRSKYYNSHDHPFFNKGLILFGLDIAKKSMSQKEAVFLVEGYTDLIAMVQSGYTNTVATLGTACTQDHLKLLARYVHKVYVLYDGDAAGKQAIVRLTKLCWQVAVDLYVVALPSQEDPMSFLSKQKSLDPLIEQAQEIFFFFIEQQSVEFGKKSLQERIELTKSLLEIMKTISDPLKQDLLLQKASTSYGIPFQTLKSEMSKDKYIATRSLQRAEQAVHYESGQEPTSLSAQHPTEALGQRKATGSAQDWKTQQKVAYSGEKLNFNLNNISILEKKLFSAILYNKLDMRADEQDLLLQWLPAPLNEFLKKYVQAQAQGLHIDSKTCLDLFDSQEKQIISRLLIEAEEEASALSGQRLLEQFYKKQWKIVVHDVKLKIEHAQKKGNTRMVQEVLSDFDTLKKKMLSRGVV